MGAELQTQRQRQGTKRGMSTAAQRMKKVANACIILGSAAALEHLRHRLALRVCTRPVPNQQHIQAGLVATRPKERDGLWVEGRTDEKRKLKPLLPRKGGART